MHFVVIGGDAAGMSAASRARRHMPELDITVFEKTQDVSYSACGLPYNIADANRDIETLVVRKAQVFRDKQNINLLTGHEVRKIDTQKKTVSGTTVEGKPFETSYDKLLIASGAAPIKPQITGVELPGIFALKSLEDGKKIKSYLTAQQVKRVVIIGMGYIALEMCEALCARGISVEMIKPRSGLLPWMPEALSSVIKEALTNNGVGIYDGHGIDKITKKNKQLHVISKDITLTAGMVLVAMGVFPNTAFADHAGILLNADNAIAVDKYMKTNIEDIYSAGDCADANHVITGKSVWLPLALRANRAGWAVADNIAGKETALEGIVGTAVFRVFDLEVARSGLTVDEAAAAGFTPVSVTIKSRSRAHGHPGSSTIWVHMVGDASTGRLLGTQMVGREGTAHRINAVAVALHAQLTVAQFSQSDLAYAPPFGPVWDPMLTAANQLLKKIEV